MICGGSGAGVGTLTRQRTIKLSSWSDAGRRRARERRSAGGVPRVPGTPYAARAGRLRPRAVELRASPDVLSQLCRRARATRGGREGEGVGTRTLYALLLLHRQREGSGAYGAAMYGVRAARGRRGPGASSASPVRPRARCHRKDGSAYSATSFCVDVLNDDLCLSPGLMSENGTARPQRASKCPSR